VLRRERVYVDTLRPRPSDRPLCQGKAKTANLAGFAADGLRGGFRPAVVDNQPWSRPIGEDRLREEFRHHVARQPARRAVHGLRGLLGLRGPASGGATNARAA
jgi:hypothetical protein